MDALDIACEKAVDEYKIHTLEQENALLKLKLKNTQGDLDKLFSAFRSASEEANHWKQAYVDLARAAFSSNVKGE